MVICPDKSTGAPAVCAFAPLRQNSTWNGGPKVFEHQNIDIWLFHEKIWRLKFFEKKNPSDHDHIIEQNSNFRMSHHFFLVLFSLHPFFLDTDTRPKNPPQKSGSRLRQNLRGTKWYPPQRRRRSFEIPAKPWDLFKRWVIQIYLLFGLNDLKWIPSRKIKISHLGKRKIIFIIDSPGVMLVPRGGIFTTSLVFGRRILSISIPSSLSRSWVLCVNWWKKSG